MTNLLPLTKQLACSRLQNRQQGAVDLAIARRRGGVCTVYIVCSIEVRNLKINLSILGVL